MESSEFSNIVSEIVEKEWHMFQAVNGEKREACQNDRQGFEALRKAEFSAWSPAAASSYLKDLELAESTGRNLVREKYIRMMKSTAPTEYGFFQNELPEISREKKALAEKIWVHMLEQTERLRKRFPAVALGGRPLYAADELDGWASIKTYRMGELLTCSPETLSELLAHIEALETQGIDLAFEIQRNSITCMGYSSMEEAERAIAFQFIQSMGGGKCNDCGVMADRI